jgi:hypothetical protein
MRGMRVCSLRDRTRMDGQTVGWTDGRERSTITLAWDYTASTLNLFMPGYIEKVPHKFQHPAPKHPQHATSKWSRPQYEVKVQLTAPVNTSQPLPPDVVKRLKNVVGTLLYYAQAADPTICVALDGLASAQTKASTTVDTLVHLLDDCTTYLDAELKYHASNMILHLHRAMPPTSPCQRYAAVRAAISSSAPSQVQHLLPTTDPSSTVSRSCATSCLLLPRPEPELYSTTAKKPPSSETHLPTWAILSRPPPSKQTTSFITHMTRHMTTGCGNILYWLMTDMIE